MDAGKQKLVISVCATVLLAIAMLLDAFKPGGEYVAKVTHFVTAIAGGAGLGWAFLRRPGDDKPQGGSQ